VLEGKNIRMNFGFRQLGDMNKPFVLTKATKPAPCRLISWTLKTASPHRKKTVQILKPLLLESLIM
jgi:hypothetical protein